MSGHTSSGSTDNQPTGSTDNQPTESRRQRAARRAGEFPPAPPPLAVPVPDSHTHLDITVDEYPDAAPTGAGPTEAAPTSAEPAGADRLDGVRGLIAAAAAVGVDRIVQVGVDVASSRLSAEWAATLPAVLATVALHPNEAPRVADLDEELRIIEGLAGQDRVRGIGETGLDTFRTGEDGRAAQEASFRAHIAIAKRYGKALVIHDREAHADVLRVLDEEGAPETVVLHCFSGDAAFAEQCVRRGYLLSFAGTVTFKNAGDLRAAAALTPLGQVLVETDAPYLTPMPYRGRPNASYLIPLTVRALSEARGVDEDKLSAALSANAERAFGQW